MLCASGLKRAVLSYELSADWHANYKASHMAKNCKNKKKYLFNNKAICSEYDYAQLYVNSSLLKNFYVAFIFMGAS